MHVCIRIIELCFIHSTSGDLFMFSPPLKLRVSSYYEGGCLCLKGRKLMHTSILHDRGRDQSSMSKLRLTIPQRLVGVLSWVSLAMVSI